MKPFIVGLVLLAGGLVAGCNSTASTRATIDRSATPLQVLVNIPGVVDPIYHDDLVRAFVDSVRESFRRQGYRAPIEELMFGESAREDQPLLTLQLVEWQLNRTGGVQCTLTARIRPVSGPEQSLGLFTTVEPGLGITNRWTLGEAFRDAAERTATDIWERLVELNVVDDISTPAVAAR